jgi:hypothetical protein
MGLLTNILYAFLKPKIDRDIVKIKNDPEYIENERQLKIIEKERAAVNKKLERLYKDSDKNLKDMQSAGIKISADMSPKEKYDAYIDWQTKERKRVGL